MWKEHFLYFFVESPKGAFLGPFVDLTFKKLIMGVNLRANIVSVEL